ncbi:hypothetical protein N5E96_25225, partial [Pseudomonas mosselii]|nr:hypothetical protein [Pseudomonas mosselii]MDH1719667.1 hypothetical protein [Pseudomonas mosselii]MDH1724593.1 hypothetical protein [Pseudomonas mosselii]
LSSTAPGMVFGNGVIKFLGSNLFARLSGYPAIFLGLASDFQKSKRQKRHGNTEASDLILYGGSAVAAGSVLVLEGGLAVSGVISVVPFAGWGAAALVLLGAVIIAGGLYLHTKAYEHIHTPIELWAARSIFGNRKNDGEVHPEVILDREKKLPTFQSLQDELKGWHDEHYRPRLISAEEAQSFGITGVDSGW